MNEIQHLLLRRKSLGLSQKELSDRANISTTTISKIERGKINSLDPDQIIRLAIAVDEDPRFWLEELGIGDTPDALIEVYVERMNRRRRKSDVKRKKGVSMTRFVTRQGSRLRHSTLVCVCFKIAPLPDYEIMRLVNLVERSHITQKVLRLALNKISVALCIPYFKTDPLFHSVKDGVVELAKNCRQLAAENNILDRSHIKVFFPKTPETGTVMIDPPAWPLITRSFFLFRPDHPTDIMELWTWVRDIDTGDSQLYEERDDLKKQHWHTYYRPILRSWLNSEKPYSFTNHNDTSHWVMLEE